MRLSNGKYFVVEYYTGLEVIGKVYHFLGDCYYMIDWEDKSKADLMMKRFNRSISMNDILHLKTFQSYKEMKEAFEFEYKLRQCCLTEIIW